MTDGCKEEDLLASRNVDIASVRTVCLALGPYRNLSTLTAAVLFLHPNCQVLNHAGERILHDERLDFLRAYSEAKMGDFLRYAIHASQSGRRGSYGGSITFSHAFDEQHVTKEVFQNSGGKLLKDEVRALFWKESLLIANHIRDQAIDLSTIFARDSRLRFLLPVRNPIDCAFSNLKTGHVTYFGNLHPQSPVEQVLDAILNEFAWCENLRSKFPDRFFVLFERDFGEPVLDDLARFLDLPPDETWFRNAFRVFNVKGHYDRPSSLVEFYHKAVSTKFASHPELRQKLLAFI